VEVQKLRETPSEKTSSWYEKFKKKKRGDNYHPISSLIVILLGFIV
jgi:hypothetical protein